jgi:hypothetical protein
MNVAERHFDGSEMETMHKMFRREFTLMPGLVRDVPDAVTAYVVGAARASYGVVRPDREAVLPPPGQPRALINATDFEYGRVGLPQSGATGSSFRTGHAPTSPPSTTRLVASLVTFLYLAHTTG